MLSSYLTDLGLGLIARALTKRKMNPKKDNTKEVRMCVLGLDNAGKTTILKAIANEEIQ